MILLTSQQLAEKLQLGTARTAAKYARDTLRVQPYSLGRGRGRGDRWDWREVEDALNRMRDGGAKPKKATPVRGHIEGRPVNDLLRELTGGTPTQ